MFCTFGWVLLHSNCGRNTTNCKGFLLDSCFSREKLNATKLWVEFSVHWKHWKFNERRLFAQCVVCSYSAGTRMMLKLASAKLQPHTKHTRQRLKRIQAKYWFTSSLKAAPWMPSFSFLPTLISIPKSCEPSLTLQVTSNLRNISPLTKYSIVWKV